MLKKSLGVLLSTTAIATFTILGWCATYLIGMAVGWMMLGNSSSANYSSSLRPIDLLWIVLANSGGVIGFVAGCFWAKSLMRR